MESYKRLSSYILATVIYDLTVEFCKRWIDYKSRTTDQMVQAARSGKQNIAEGASVQSLESYIKLLGVTEGSQRELAADYEDFLRQKGLPIWEKEDSRVREVRLFRAVWVSPNQPNTPNLPNDPEVAANMMLTYCQMETYLLKRQIDALKEKFVKEGGFRENLFKERMNYLRRR
jgi:four helix bundle suffix protein